MNLIIFIFLSIAFDRHQSKDCITMEEFEKSIKKAWKHFPGIDELLNTSTFLGEGSYGKVSSVHWEPLKKEVAVKKLTFSKKKWKKEIAEIEKEVSISKALNQVTKKRKRSTFTPSPEIYYCVLNEDERSNSYAYVIMELMKTSLELSCLTEKDTNCPLRYWAAREEDDRLRLFVQIAKSIKLMHDKKYVHDDLKPDNIASFNEEITQFKLIDFGMSGEIKTKSKGGTLFYMDELRMKWFNNEQTASEIKKTESNLRTPITDIYSFGVTMAEMLFAVGAYLQKLANIDIFKGLSEELERKKYNSRATSKLVSQKIFSPSNLRIMGAFTCVMGNDEITPVCVYHAIFGALIQDRSERWHLTKIINVLEFIIENYEDNHFTLNDKAEKQVLKNSIDPDLMIIKPGFIDLSDELFESDRII